MSFMQENARREEEHKRLQRDREDERARREEERRIRDEQRQEERQRHKRMMEMMMKISMGKCGPSQIFPKK